jgi:ATP-binding cassette subfamily B protein
MLPLASALNLLQPYLIKLAIDRAIVPEETDLLGPIIGTLIGALLLERLARYGEMLLLQLCGQRAMNDLRERTHRHMLSLASSYFDRTPVGRLMTRVTNDIESIAEAFAQGIVTVLGDILLMTGIVVVMVWLSPKLALLTLAVAPVLLLVVRLFRRLVRDAHRAIRRRIAEINAIAQEHISGMSVVQIFGQQLRALRAFNRANAAHRDAYRAAIRYDSSLYATVELLSSLTIALLLWYGGVRVLADDGGTVTLGLLVAFIEYVQKFFVPIRDMSVKYMAMQQAMAASERVFNLLDNDEVERDTQAAPRRGLGTPAAARRCAPDAAVAFQAVSFGYAPDQQVLHSVSFEVPRGESLAIVGATGSGKSTLIRLLDRLYEVQDGRICLAGADVRTIPLRDLRRRVVVVSQDVFLFAGTVADNISLQDPEVTPERVREAAERLGLTRLLALDREVLERGADLSAGERQLVAFARALARDPEVLVLDEATASVDPESERLVQAGVAELMRGRTSIVIAHRLSTIEQVDRILVIRDGAIAEQGTHSELLEAGGTYSRLYRLQYVTTAK